MSETPGPRTRGMGWRPDLPDRRDLLLLPELDPTSLPRAVDLRSKDATGVYDQGQLGSCTANAIAGALRFTLKAQGLADVDPSRLYIYFEERKAEGSVGFDSGAMIRDGLKVVAAGFVPEADWPYDPATFATPPRPVAQLEAAAAADHVTRYMQVTRDTGMRACLAAGFPFVFGITVYDSFERAVGGAIPMPSAADQVLGGHALLCVGYDDTAQLYEFKNSWGPGWGAGGFGTLPYAYLHDPQLSSDCWTIRAEVEG